MTDCLFCRIIAKEIPSKTIHEDDLCVAFHDIRPAAKTHLLVVPKKHIATLKDLKEEEGDEALMGHMMVVAKSIAQELGLPGYKLSMNVDKAGGQEIFHLHLHLLSNT